jgi:hypothetical protein
MLQVYRMTAKLTRFWEKHERMLVTTPFGIEPAFWRFAEVPMGAQLLFRGELPFEIAM